MNLIIAFLLLFGLIVSLVANIIYAWDSRAENYELGRYAGYNEAMREQDNTRGCKCHKSLKQVDGYLRDIKNELILTDSGDMLPDSELLRQYTDKALAIIEKEECLKS